MSNTERLVLKTRKSIYPPIEIEVEGVIHQSKKFTHPLRIILEPLEKKIDVTKPDWESLCKWMNAVFGLDKKVLNNLETDEVEDIYLKVKVELLGRQRDRMTKSMDAIEAEVDGVEKVTKKVKDIGKITEEIAKNAKRPGEKT